MRTRHLLLALGCALLVSGCAMHKMSSPGAYAGQAIASVPGQPQPQRMMIWNADLSIDVWSISNAVRDALAMTAARGGFVEQKTEHGEQSVSMKLRLPAAAFQDSLAALEALGTVTYRNMHGKDVTEQYIDVQARLKNKYVLRDRLKQILEKAVTVQDVLAVETELNRVQSDIDSMEGQIKSLQGQIQYATLDLDLKRKQILGPLGYVFKGIWWGVEKLFVIRE